MIRPITPVMASLSRRKRITISCHWDSCPTSLTRSRSISSTSATEWACSTIGFPSSMGRCYSNWIRGSSQASRISASRLPKISMMARKTRKVPARYMSC